MSDLQNVVTLISLCVMALSYLVIMFFFLITERAPLNYALATQSGLWLAIIALITIPNNTRAEVISTPSDVKTVMYAALSIVTVWVLTEVYRANRGRIRTRLLQIVRRDPTATWPEIERRSGQDRRRQVEP